MVLLQSPSLESIYLSFCYWRYLWLYPFLEIVLGCRKLIFSKVHTSEGAACDQWSIRIWRPSPLVSIWKKLRRAYSSFRALIGSVEASVITTAWVRLYLALLGPLSHRYLPRGLPYSFCMKYSIPEPISREFNLGFLPYFLSYWMHQYSSCCLNHTTRDGFRFFSPTHASVAWIPPFYPSDHLPQLMCLFLEQSQQPHNLLPHGNHHNISTIKQIIAFIILQ